MKIIVCLDDNSGMMFNRRRQSRDRVVIDDIIACAQGGELCVDSYSVPLFDGKNIKLSINDDFANKPKKNDICFVEHGVASALVSFADEVTIYRWNRLYPSDVKFDADLEKMGFRLTLSTDFAGYSHEKITKEIFSK